MIDNVDVVVVGAGPVGLLMAIELHLAGVQALVLERLAAPSLVLKAGGIGPIGTEALQRRGMAAPIDAAEARAFALREAVTQPEGQTKRGPRFAGHFAGLTLIRADAQKEPGRRSRLVDQQTLEAILADRVCALGIEVRRGYAVASTAQDADGVDVAWKTPTGEGHIRCRYLVGCDGGRSPIRKMAGFAFPGTDPTMTMYQADVTLDQENLLSRGFCYTTGGMYISGFVPGRLALMDFSGPPNDRDAPVSREEFETALRRVSATDVRVPAIENASRWTDHARMVDTYRHDRVLLAGDAAHIHAPFGGQGLSLGLADAANLGWKLAAVVRGDRPESLLDTYTAERRPVAEAVLANTRAQIAIMRPDPQSSAMRALVAALMQDDTVNSLFGDMMSGLGTRYDLGVTRDEVGRLIGDRPVGSSSDVGHAEGQVEGSLYDLMHDGSGVFLDASAGGAMSARVAAIPRIRCVAVETGASMLIRPDACIAWAGDGDDTDSLDAALQRWFDPPQDVETVAQAAQ